MTIDIVITDPCHPLIAPVGGWIAARPPGQARLLHDLSEATGGDILVLVACHQIARQQTLRRYRRAYVTHASDLPRGRGWSPLVWSVLEGAQEIVLSLIEPAEPVDSGGVYAKFRHPLAGTELWDDLNAALAALIVLALDFAAEFPESVPTAQSGEPSWYPRRRPSDGGLDPDKSISSQFDRIRVADPRRFPAFFDFRGQRYAIVLHKVPKDDA